MRVGRIEEASALARRVAVLIERKTRQHLADLGQLDDLGELWRRVGQVTKRRPMPPPSSTITADSLNDHYADVSTDNSYIQPAYRLSVPTNRPVFSDMRVFHLLDHLHHTADGADKLPAWYLHLP